MANLAGWYYDIQTGYEGPGRMTCVTLHPNTTDTGQKEWSDNVGDPDNPAYSASPICVAIANEDFNVSIANTWSEFGGDMIGQLWEQAKILAPYADHAEKMIHKAVEEYHNASQTDRQIIQESKISRAFARTFEKIDEGIQSGQINITDYLNRSLIVQGTRFSYYSGTGISFGNLVMKFTMFPTWKGPSFVSVDDQLEKIYPYVMGHFIHEDALKVDEDGMIGWQLPPAGFRADVKNVDNVQKGTLLLKYGAYYSVENLVCENASFSYSKQMVKHPHSKGDYSPLYCDVTLQLRPATKFSDNKLKKFVKGTSCLPVTYNAKKGAMAGAV